ncbi:CIS tube protein [Leptothoe sp. PORK10 BA2]|uniref:CIS tube protein n=1 Tax=Leptothoe sp. PORK10 BA2 TaxID=3110254 RepID=UPI002B1EF666|nr:hypothetical protein [Leptothoe sp. PORK10 BA2]MEA5463918.1 hypothetical protein [Leptothoe sp. PORK10 BA2]
MTALQKAFFKVLSGRNQNQEVPIHFNPVSLQYTVSNTLEEQGSGNRRKQHVTQSSGKLTMDLIFDTTYDGSDVRRITDKVAQFMQPDSQNAPPVVEFEWGSYSFRGMVESFKETIDFFAPTGVPLRASVNLTLAQQDTVFEPNNYSQFDQNNSLTPDSVDVPAPFEPANYAQKDVTQLATQSGNPQAGRALAALNRLESMRFPAGAITVPEGIDLRGPVAFSAGISDGLSLGVSGGFSGSSSGGSSARSSGSGLGLSLNLGGLASSAGVSAREGAFGQLKTPTGGASVQLDPLRLIGPPAAGLTGDLASFQVGGQSTSPGAGSFKADVGANADLRSRLQFRSG